VSCGGGGSCCFVVLDVPVGEHLSQEGQKEWNGIGKDRRVGHRRRGAV